MAGCRTGGFCSALLRLQSDSRSRCSSQRPRHLQANRLFLKIANIYNHYLLMQFFIVSMFDPIQSGPPSTGGGLLHVRFLLMDPAMQALHSLQADQLGQGRTSARDPTQSAPPLAGGGLSHWRMRNCCPPPSVGHLPQPAQPENFPSITAK